MGKFYVIKIVPKEGESGFIIDSPEGIKVSIGSLAGEVIQFSSVYEAKKFIFDNQLERKGAKAYVRSNEELIDEKVSGAKVLKGSVFYLQNEDGENLYYDTKKAGYYFDKKDVGQCCWNSKRDLELFIEQVDFDISVTIKEISQ